MFNKKNFLKLYAGLQALLLSGVSLAACSSDNTEQVATNPIEIIVDVTTPEETTTYEAVDTTTAKIETTKPRVTTTKVYTTEVTEETTLSGSTEKTEKKDNKTSGYNGNSNDNSNDNGYADNGNNYVNNGNSNSGRTSNGTGNNNSGRTSNGNNGSSGNNSQTPQGTQAPVTQPPVTEPPVQVTEAPRTEPPVQVTEAPVTQPPVPSYSLSAIFNSVGDYYNISNDLCYDIMFSPASGCTTAVYLPSGYYCTGAVGTILLLGALNPGVDDSVLSTNFSIYTQDELSYANEFVCNLFYVLDCTHNEINFRNYCSDPNLGDYLNYVRSAYLNNENINLNYLDNPGVCGILSGLGCGVSSDNMKNYTNHISQITYGNQLVLSNSLTSNVQ